MSCVPLDGVLTVTIHPTQCKATFDDRLDVTKPTYAIFLLADVQNGEELDLDETDVIELIENKNYKVHMDVRVKQNIRKTHSQPL